MQILYKGKSSTYVGECECGTIILAKESEVKLKCYNQTHTYFSAKCPECGAGIVVYKEGCERANGIRSKALLNQKEANRRSASAFLAGFEELLNRDAEL